MDVHLQMERAVRLLVERAVLFAPRLAMALAIVAAAWIAALLVVRVTRRVTRPLIHSPEVIGVLATTIKVGILSVGIVSALGTLGINVMGMVAGLGLAGFAIGFALKDALSNALSGILILMYRPYRRGDRMAVSGFDGEVADIDLRYTTLHLDDGRTALIPNSSIFTNPLVVRRPPLATTVTRPPLERPSRTAESAA